MGNFIINRALLAFLFLLFVSPVKTQTDLAPQASRSATAAKSGKSAGNGEAERITRERRASALSLLVSLTSDAGKFSDLVLRARTHARIADTFWESDAEQGRALFRRAWEAAEIADREGQQQGGAGGSYTVPTNSREEVLRLAARRDRALGEEFLGRLKEQKQEDAAEAQARLNVGLFKISDEAARQRLNLARQLLDSGDLERAIQFADSALRSVNIETIDFLSSLREKNPTAADQRYTVLLTKAPADLQSDTDSEIGRAHV